LISSLDLVHARHPLGRVVVAATLLWRRAAFDFAAGTVHHPTHRTHSHARLLLQSRYFAAAAAAAALMFSTQYAFFSKEAPAVNKGADGGAGSLKSGSCAPRVATRLMLPHI